jgi:hypothetical protein
MKACTDLLYIFVMNWDNSHHYISRYSYFNISCCNIIFFSRISQLYEQSHLKQLIAAMSVNQHSKWCLSDSLRFEEKRVKFRPWLQQIVAKLNVNMSDNNVSVQFWYLHSWAWRVGFKSGHTWIVACIKSNEVLNHTIIEKLINQLQHVYNDSELKKRATHILKALKQKENHLLDIWPPLNKHCWKQRLEMRWCC